MQMNRQIEISATIIVFRKRLFEFERTAAPLRRIKKVVNTPPAKAGGFGLRLKAGSIGHSADYHSLSHPGEGWGEGIKQDNCFILYPLILAFSPRGPSLA
jgi:hypothetical protein